MAFGKEPQIFEKSPSVNSPARKPLYETIKGIEEALKERGLKKEDIEAAMLLMKQIGFLDRRVFPENPAAFNFALIKEKDSAEGRDLAGLIIPEGDEKDRSYQIIASDLAKRMESEGSKDVSIFDAEGKRKSDKQFMYGLSVAAHEVRHRVQRDCGVRQFSPEDAKLIKDKVLSSVIKFQEMLFEETRKIYQSEKKSREFIKNKLSPKEFDASVIERFVGNKLNEIPRRLGAGIEQRDLDEFASIIQISAPEKDKR